jgi:hypothetical protein
MKYRVVMSYEVKADSLEEAVKIANGLKEGPTPRGWINEVKELPDA